MTAVTQPEFKPAGAFDCCECGRHIVVIAGPISEFHLCAACLMVPGWHEIPAMHDAIVGGDFEGERTAR